MPYLLFDGDRTQKAIALYTRCEDVLLGKAELLLLKELAQKDYPGQTILGFLDTDPAYTIGRFKRSYRGRPADYRKLMAYRQEILKTGWEYPDMGAGSKC